MSPDYKRSIRLNQLLVMALKGATEDTLRKKCKSWGVVKQTEDSYIEELLIKVRSFKKNV